MTRTHRKATDERLYAAAGNAYRFEGFRYDSLSDAVSYSTLMRQRRSDAGT